MESGFLSPQMLHRSRLAVPIQYIPPSRVTHSSSKEDVQKLADETVEAKAYQDTYYCIDMLGHNIIECFAQCKIKWPLYTRCSQK
ncbi:hypothetical protein QL285_040679 [Trifolium repens]|nr:hypothetical protein QL285_040679 [Trifolium repens]